MDFFDAMTTLGVDWAVRDLTEIRQAYLAAIREAHPDTSDHPDSVARAAAIIGAYDLVQATITNPSAGGIPTPPSRSRPANRIPAVRVRMVNDDTIEIAAPVDESFALLAEVAHRAGEIIYLDRSAPLLQLLVQFDGAPPSQVIFDLQGRAAHGTTEIFCTIESMDEREPPPVEDVAQFVSGALRQAANQN